MRRARNKFLAAIFFGLVLLLAMPAISLAQGRGQGRGRWRDSKSERKYRKFVNGHDARDGRWDGRGPQRNAYRRNTYYRRNGFFVNRGDRVGYRNRYSTNDYWRRRHSTYRRNSDMNWRYRSYRRRY
jgi:hypothetical protein